MSAAKPKVSPAPHPLLLAYEVAQLGTLLQGPDSSHRTALQAVHQAIEPWRTGDADEDDVLAKVAEIAGLAFTTSTDLNRPECWALGFICATLGACTALPVEEDAAPAASPSPSGDMAAAIAAQLVGVCAQVARKKPQALPLGVSLPLYQLVASDVAKRIEAAGAAAMRRAYGTSGGVH